MKNSRTADRGSRPFPEGLEEKGISSREFPDATNAAISKSRINTPKDIKSIIRNVPAKPGVSMTWSSAGAPKEWKWKVIIRNDNEIHLRREMTETPLWIIFGNRIIFAIAEQDYNLHPILAEMEKETNDDHQKER